MDHSPASEEPRRDTARPPGTNSPSSCPVTSASPRPATTLGPAPESRLRTVRRRGEVHALPGGTDCRTCRAGRRKPCRQVYATRPALTRDGLVAHFSDFGDMGHERFVGLVVGIEPTSVQALARCLTRFQAALRLRVASPAAHSAVVLPRLSTRSGWHCMSCRWYAFLISSMGVVTGTPSTA